MKKLLVRKQSSKLIDLSLYQMIGVGGIVMLMILLNSCASPPFVSNIESKSELKGDKKVLAGRFACFDNDAPVHCTKSGFLIYFNREGDSQAKLFTPDDAGYVYIAVTEGYYVFGRFVKGGKNKSFIFDPDLFPVLLVRPEDSVVNFGTLEVRFYLQPGTKGSTSQSRGEEGSFRINHIANYDATRSEIASRLGKIAGSMNDGAIQFLPKGRR
jgi:hypothetical protein